jgi:hypothetical protein
MNSHMLNAIESGIEHIIVENFLAVRSGRMDIDNITAIIGPQASGKSIFAKLVYFGRTYLEYYFHSVFQAGFEIRQFKVERVNAFLELFGGLDGFDHDFSVTYTYGFFEVCISRALEGHKPKVSQNKELEKCGVALKREYARYSNRQNEEVKRRVRPASAYGFMNEDEGVKNFFASIPSVLFVPASRSFYSTISEELFTFLASDERVDPLTAQFGSFYEFAKRKVGGDWYGSSLSASARSELNAKLRPVIDGDFVRIKSKDYIKTDWGRVPLRSSSSGQQESLPLLFSLLEYPGSASGPHLIIVEEPEAHLFPTAQKYVLDLMVNRVLETNCDILFTTHSPYVLACLNIHVARFKGKKVRLGRDITLGAWLAQSGTLQSIVEQDSGLVDTNFLDEVSGEIVNEFLEASK